MNSLDVRAMLPGLGCCASRCPKQQYTCCDVNKPLTFYVRSPVLGHTYIFEVTACDQLVFPHQAEKQKLLICMHAVETHLGACHVSQ